MQAGAALARVLCCAWFALHAGVAPADEAYSLPPARSADFAAILEHQGDVAVFDYGGRSLILIIDFPTLVEQGKMFNRLVALIERIGAPRERVLDNAELAEFIRSTGKTEATFAYGNDFLVAELVVFFNLAEMGGIALTPQEVALRELLLARGLMAQRNGFLQAITPQAVILSLPQVGTGGAGHPPVSELARRTILMHEISHAEYYTNPRYADYCRQFWRRVMNDRQRQAFRAFLANSSYDSGKEEMMINEAQAYLVHTPDPRAFNARMVGLKDPEVEALRERFRAGLAAGALAGLGK